MDDLFAAIIERDGRKFLFWLEPEGDQLKLHQITTVHGVGVADVSVTFTPASGVSWGEVWAHFAKDDFAKARHNVLTSISPFEQPAGEGRS